MLLVYNNTHVPNYIFHLMQFQAFRLFGISETPKDEQFKKSWLECKIGLAMAPQ